MEAKRYRKKPVVIEAMEWDGTDETLHQIQGWAGMWETKDGHPREIVVRAEVQWAFPPEGVTALVWDRLHATWVGVKTGQHIICGVQGEHYPIDPDVLAETYEEVGDER